MALRVLVAYGDEQAVEPGGSFQPLAVKYSDADTDEPASGTQVDFQIVGPGSSPAQFQGGGQKFTTSTDAHGVANATVIAGSLSGDFQVEATAEVNGPRVRAGYVFSLSVS
jgi:hypothetical protein